MCNFISKGVGFLFQWRVMLCLKEMGLDEKCVKQANEFIPERFIGVNSLRPHPFAYLPYSYGKRQCVGRKLADLMFRNLAARVSNWISFLFNK